jgi:hypothetical protein
MAGWTRWVQDDILGRTRVARLDQRSALDASTKARRIEI